MVNVPAMMAASFKLNIRLSINSMFSSALALRKSHKAQRARIMMASNEGKIRTFNQLTDTPATIINNSNKVEMQDISAAPALEFASARPERTSIPKLAMVAVLETKPDAIDERMRAFFEDSKRFAICAKV